MTTIERLNKLRACEDAVEWAQGKTIEQIIADCHRGDWLLWLAAKLNIDDRPLTLAKGHCAATVLHLMKDQRSKDAVQAAIDYGEGKISKEVLKAAADAAYAAAVDAYAAAYAAAVDAYAAADAADAAYSAAYYSAAYAADAAGAEARQANQKQTADICRKYLTEEIMNKWNETLEK